MARYEAMTGNPDPRKWKAQILSISEVAKGNPDEAMKAWVDFCDEKSEADPKIWKYAEFFTLNDLEVFDALLPLVSPVPNQITNAYFDSANRFLEKASTAINNSTTCSHIAHSGLIAATVAILQKAVYNAASEREMFDPDVLEPSCKFMRQASVNTLMRGYLINSDCVSLLKEVITHRTTRSAEGDDGEFNPSPHFFGVLSALARQSKQVKQQIHSGGAQLLLDAFKRDPVHEDPQFSTSEDPAAELFFLSVWSLEELSQYLSADPGTFGVLVKAHSLLYGPVAVFKDSILPMTDLLFDVASAVTYWRKGRYQWLALVGSSMVFNTAAGTFLLSTDTTTATLHAATLGLYGVYKESRHSWATGLKSDQLKTLKMLECAESSVSFVVGVYSILIAGYLDGYPPLHLLEATTRWCSVGTSLVTIPMGVYDYVHGDIIQKGNVTDYPYALGAREACFCFMLLMFQGSEIWSHIALVCMQLLTRPFGLVYLLGAHYLLVALLMLIGGEQPLSIVLGGPILVAFQFGVHGPNDPNLFFRVAILRILILISAWTTSVVVAMHLHDGAKLIDHLQQPSCLALVSLAAIGSITYFLSFFYQAARGRWSQPRPIE